MHTVLQAQDISPTILFAVWDGRDGENLPIEYKSVFFDWWSGEEWGVGSGGGTNKNFALTYVQVQKS